MRRFILATACLLLAACADDASQHAFRPSASMDGMRPSTGLQGFAPGNHNRVIHVDQFSTVESGGTVDTAWGPGTTRTLLPPTTYKP